MSPEEFRFKDTRKMPHDTPDTEHLGAPAPTATPTPTPPPAPPESTHFQILYTGYDAPPGHLPPMRRHGVASTDLALQSHAALELMKRHDVQEVFICTVHTAFVKDLVIKKAI